MSSRKIASALLLNGMLWLLFFCGPYVFIQFEERGAFFHLLKRGLLPLMFGVWIGLLYDKSSGRFVTEDALTPGQYFGYVVLPFMVGFIAYSILFMEP